jgi:hypothetical protein
MKIPGRVEENIGLVFVLPLIFAAAFLVLSIIPTLVGAYFWMAVLVDIALVVVALDTFAGIVYGIVWLLSE